ncbi:enoyl-CoA hydratase/isomerase family protein [Amycolatopsis pithecellobii]|uniref:Enoyl-CoA hydratase/isomerase family protein n=1 Tax=Amycolatopsis pithecellobii TaxID=664692 RepID=A0A6N7Z7A5_9PSEU|nr:enoyl-CoA hydratase/isomerase family protein [Amycolatopsis pithecellobii]MTD55736.1 enoyl-CoA hydratase/isomerase family protein [Amycolatopsis pithecellobii]
MTVVRFRQDGAVGHLILAGGPNNWVDDEFRHEIREAVHAASESDIRALLIEAEGPNFSVGGAAHEWPGKSRDWFRTFIAEIDTAYRAIEALRVPVVAAVRGLAVGGGFELALAADFLVAAENAVFWNIEINGNNVPLAGGLQRLATKIGPVKATKMAMLGEPTPVREIPELASYVVPDDELDEFAAKLATRLSQGATQALAVTRTLLKAWSIGGTAAADRLTHDLTIDLWDSPDTQAVFQSVKENHDERVKAEGPDYAGPATAPPHVIFTSR